MKLELLEDKKASWGRSWWKLGEPIAQGKFIAPKGFETDLASVPRPFWFFVNPTGPQVARCAVIHDLLCKQAENWGQRKAADYLFFHCLLSRGIFFRAPLMLLGVRLNALLTHCFKGYQKNGK